MDKVKIALDLLKKYHFWALAVLVLVLGLGIYMAAAKGLKSQYDKRVTTLKTASQSVDRLAGRPDHPNEQRIANWKAKRQEQEQKVFEAWRKLYDQQKAINPWPRKLGPKFLAVVEPLDSNEAIPRGCRTTYWNNIDKAIPELLETVDFRREVEVEPGEAKNDTPAAEGAPPGRPGQLGGPSRPGRLGGLPGANQENTKTIGTIDWSENQRQAILAQFYWSSLPSSLRVRLAQEDYWVYKALLTIISKTNGDAKTHSDAAIKEIVSLDIGKDATAYLASNRPSIVPEAAVPTAMGGGAEMGGSGTRPGGYGYGYGVGPVGPEGAMHAGGPTGQGPAAAQDNNDALLEFRYVDRDMKPLSAETVKNSPPYVEFKMVPVVMVLVVDQRKIPDLLVECANSTMPVEVVQVRINHGAAPENVPSPSGYGGGMHRSGGPEGGSPMGAGLRGPGRELGGPMGGMGMYGGARPGASPGLEDEEASPYEVQVEVRGIMYIYNPPRESKAQLAEESVS